MVKYYVELNGCIMKSFASIVAAKKYFNNVCGYHDKAKDVIRLWKIGTVANLREIILEF